MENFAATEVETEEAAAVEELEDSNLWKTSDFDEYEVRTVRATNKI